MATTKIDKFGGLIPRVHPSLIPDGMATDAMNCRLKSGKLVPLRQPEQIAKSRVLFENGLQRISDAHSMYCWKYTLKGGEVKVVFLAFPGEVYFAKSNIADDEYDRIFVSGETGISYTDEQSEVHENCPAVYLHSRENDEFYRHCICLDRLSGLRVSVGKPGTSETSPRWTSFFVSWFDKWGYESPISDPSMAKNGDELEFTEQLLECNDGDTIHFEPIAVPASAAGIRVYKTCTGTDTASIQFCFEISGMDMPKLQDGFDVEVSGMDSGEVYPGIEQVPYDVTDVTMMDAGFYVGRAERKPHTVMFSEVDMPTSWPVAYWYDIGDNIQRIAVVASTVYALTDGNPYVISGTSPDTMTVARIGSAAACVSKRGVCVMDNRLYFVSNRGLFAMASDSDSGMVCRCVTEQFFTKEQWEALNPASALLYGHDGAIYMFFTKEDGENVGYIWDLADSTPVLTQHDEFANCMCTDDRTDDMYFVRSRIGRDA